MKKLSFTLYFCVSTLFLFAQSTNKEGLPNGTNTPEDKIVNTLPPDYPVRAMAEWEEIETLLLSWDKDPILQTEIVRHAVNECKVIIIAKTATAKGEIETILNLANIPLTNVDFLVQHFNTVWIRDYGPWSVYANDVEELAITDWIYDRPLRTFDDVISEKIADKLNLPFYEAIDNPNNWIHSGGNVLRDGMGTGFSSDLVYLDNPTKNQQQLSDITNSFLGFNQYNILPRLQFDRIHHLDMHMRLIDEETIIIGQYPTGIADGPQIEKNIDFIKNNWRTPFGNPYTILRVEMPPDNSNGYPDNGGYYRTYTNAIFINKTILVPIYDDVADEEALGLYREQLPGYNVVGLDCNTIIKEVGAIHCITKLVGIKSPLWIAHPKLRNTFITTSDYLVEAIIKHESGIVGADLFYRQAGELIYTSLPMLRNFNTDEWQAEIPAQLAATTIEYYIEARANNGKIQRRPIVAPEGFFRFEIMAAQAQPKADFTKKETTICDGISINYHNHSSDDVISWNWTFPGGEPATSTEQNPQITYMNAGIFNAQLTVENAIGSDTFLWEDVINVSKKTLAIKPFEENFEGGSSIPWKISNPGNDSRFWEIIEDENCMGNHFLRMNGFSNTSPFPYTRDYYSIQTDLRGFSNTILSFDVAYASRPKVYNEKFFRKEELRINIIQCNGQKNVIYNNNGSSLATSITLSGSFSPNCDEWRLEEIDLSAYDGEVIEIEFEGINEGGNRLYVDNIAVKATPVPNLLPYVSIYRPTNETTLTTIAPPTLPITVQASDVDGEITSVSFFINGAFIAVDETMPYAIDYKFPDFGDYTLFVRATDNDGDYKDSAPVTIHLNQKKIPFEEAINVFPIPAQKHLYFSLFSNEVHTIHYDIYNAYAYGQLVRSGDWKIEKGENAEIISLQQLASGTYYINFSGKDWQVLRRFIIVD